jgi:CHASE3 domain sensor protein
MQMSGITKTKVWLGVGIAALVLITLTAGLEFPSERQFRVALQHTYVMVIVMDVLCDLEDAQAHEQGYLLTAEPSELNPLGSLREGLDQEFDRLRGLTKRNPVKQHQIEKIQFLVHQELNEFQTAIDARAMISCPPARMQHYNLHRNQPYPLATRISPRRWLGFAEPRIQH